MTEARRKVNSGNLRMLAWRRGFHGVVGLAKAIGRSRVTVHRAVKRPNSFRPTYTLVEKALGL